MRGKGEKGGREGGGWEKETRRSRYEHTQPGYTLLLHSHYIHYYYTLITFITTTLSLHSLLLHSHYIHYCYTLITFITTTLSFHSLLLHSHYIHYYYTLITYTDWLHTHTQTHSLLFRLDDCSSFLNHDCTYIVVRYSGVTTATPSLHPLRLHSHCIHHYYTLITFTTEW